MAFHTRMLDVFTVSPACRFHQSVFSPACSFHQERLLTFLSFSPSHLLVVLIKSVFSLVCCCWQLLEQSFTELQNENARVTSELGDCHRRITDQGAEISTLKELSSEINQKLDKSTAKVQNLIIHINQSKAELESAQKQVREKDDVISNLRCELSQSVNELAEKTKRFEKKELEYETLMTELQIEIRTLETRLVSSEQENAALRETVRQLRREVEMLKRKLASDTSFRQFVDIKRNYNTLKNVSGTLAQKVQIYEKEMPLPVVKKSGKTVKVKTNVTGVGTRPRSAILNRPKSARVLVQPAAGRAERLLGELPLSTPRPVDV